MRNASCIRLLVNGGVTTLRDVGGATHLLKRLIQEGFLIGPRLKIAICMLSTTGGHADFRGPDRCCGEVSRLWPPGPGRPSSIVDGPWACRKRVREIAACGADLVKVCASPGVVSPGDKLENRDFTAQEIDAICDEAAGRGLYVAGHAHSRNGIALSIEHGIKDIQHISFLDETLAEQAYAKGCTVTPTSWITQSLEEAKGLSDFVQQKVLQVAEAHSQSVRIAHASGLNMLAGTDPVLPNMHGRNFMELVALMNDGIPALTAWYGATGLAARLIGQEDSGVLTSGHRADLLMCRGDVVAQPGLFDQGALLEVVKDGDGLSGRSARPSGSNDGFLHARGSEIQGGGAPFRVMVRKAFHFSPEPEILLVLLRRFLPYRPLTRLGERKIPVHQFGQCHYSFLERTPGSTR